MASIPADRFIAACWARWAGLTYQVPNCRKIAGSNRWSQHAYRNAVDIFGPKATLDRVAAFARAQPDDAHVLWQVKNHYDHVHVDFNPLGTGLPNCAGGSGDPPQNTGGGTAPVSPLSGGIVSELGVLKKGDRNRRVGILQAMLNGAGKQNSWWDFELVLDDDYGPNTENVVKMYQHRVGLTPDGQVGPLTWRRLLFLP